MIKKKGKDIFSLMKADHDKVEALFQKLEKTDEHATYTRDKFYEELRTELAIHTEAEEMTLYPTLKLVEQTQDIGFEAVEEHAIIHYLINKIDGTPYDSLEWMAQLKALREVVRHHVKEEESVMFRKMRKAFTEDELRYFADSFQQMKKAAKELQDSAGVTVTELGMEAA